MRKPVFLHKIAFFMAAVLLLVSCPLYFSSDTAPEAAAADAVLTQISAAFLGNGAVVGQKIEEKDLYVTGHYVSNGRMTTSQIKEGFTITPSTILLEGENVVTVTYDGFSANVTIMGKLVTSLFAEYKGSPVTVGQTVSPKDVKVTAYYSNGSSEMVDDFVVPVTIVTAAGTNTLTVIYGGQTTTFFVEGVAVVAVQSLTAYYTGEPVIVGNKIDKTKIEVSAYYNNGKMETAKNFSISPETVTKAGSNKIMLSYGGATTTLEVEGLEKEIVSIEAKYIGPGVVVGKTVSMDDIEVMATYNDESVGRTNAFTISGALINAEGENVVVVYCGNFIEQVVVNGIVGYIINYDNKVSNVIFGGYNSSATVTMALRQDAPANKFLIAHISEDLVEQAVYRVFQTDKFIAFEISYDDDEMITQFPTAVKVTLPSGYDAKRFGVYFTPNRSTIMAKMNGEFLDDKTEEYEFMVYQPGTYILVQEISDLLVESIEIEKEMQFRAGRNYSLYPLVLPAKAVNQKVTYWSSDEEILTVSESGKVCTYKEGKCEIWIEATDDSDVKAVISVTVVK